ncbi:MAG: GNAT family N-acetyltransferase, partial [Pseudomonadota bacterium]|nr:GNAT family N-acetyltransferase [Pseudomonadota bacterium]
LLANRGLNVPTLYTLFSEVANDGGVAFFGFNVDPDFNDCIDGLVVVDMQTLTEKKRKRYLTDIQLKATA